MRDHTDKPNVQWQCSNLGEIEEFLEEYHVRMKAVEDDCLMIQGYGGVNILLAPGDCLVLDGDSLGVIRVPSDAQD